MIKTNPQVAVVGLNVRAWSSMGLLPNTSYSHRVRAYNALGNSNYSNNSTTKTLR